MANTPRGSTQDVPPPGEVKVSPRVRRFVYAGFFVLGLAAIVLSWNKPPAALVAVAIVLIVLATIVTLLSSALTRRQAFPALVCLWAVLVISIAIALLFLSSLFLGIPERGAVFVARLLGDPRLAVFSNNTEPNVVEADKKSLPDTFRQAPVTVGDQYDEAAALSKIPPVTIKGATIIIDSPIVYFSVLRLQDAELQTGGRDVTIKATRIETIGSAAIRAAVPASQPGQAGKPGGTVTIVVYDRLAGAITVDLKGGDGGQGANGAAGIQGGNGSPGENSASGLFDCSHGGGPGGAGQPGGPGGNGQPGLPGGDGGRLIFRTSDPDRYSGLITFTAKGGVGGPGGAGGAGGPGGNGGPGGHGGGYCGGGQAGPGGPIGKAGISGPGGSAGKDGTFIKSPL